MVTEIRADHESDWAAMSKVAELLGIGTAETIRKWYRQAEIDAGNKPGATSEESAELKRLKRENAELKRANAMLKSGGCRTNRLVWRCGWQCGGRVEILSRGLQLRCRRS